MKTGRWLRFAAALALALIACASSHPPARSMDRYQDIDPDSCAAILEQAAESLGWSPDSYTLEDGAYYCELDYLGGEEKITLQLNYDIWDWEADCECGVCLDSDVCECTDFHGNPAEYYPGFFFRFCDETCQVQFSINTPVVDESIGLVWIAESLYTAAQDAGCFQTEPPPAADPTTAPPPEEFPALPTEDIPAFPTEVPEQGIPLDDFNPVTPEVPGDSQSPAPEVDLGRRARNPLVPLFGAALGSLLGILVSLGRTWLAPVKPPAPPLRRIRDLPQPPVQAPPLEAPPLEAPPPEAPSPQPPVQPPEPAPAEPPLQPPAETEPQPGNHKEWNEWETKLPEPAQDKPVAEPTLSELRQHRLDAVQAKDTILGSYQNDIPAARLAAIDPARVHFVDKATFDQRYKSTFQRENTEGATGIADPNTFEVYIDQENCINYTSVHEILHLTSNSRYGQVVKTAMDEATTEFFTLQLAAKNQVARISQYTLNDSTKVIEELVKQVGEPALREAFFGADPGGVDKLRRLVDQKLRPGAFDKVIDLMERGKHLHARELLRGINVRP